MKRYKDKYSEQSVRNKSMKEEISKLKRKYESAI